MAAKKGFAVTVEGQYMVDNMVGRNRVSEKKNYTVVVNVPKYGQNTLSIIKNRLLESAIRRYDPAYKTYVTHSITGVQPLGDSPDQELSGRLLTTNNMSVTQLVKYVQGQKLPVAIHLYEQDILEFRKAIDSCKADQKKFLAKQNKLQEDYEIQKELQDLNPDLETKGDVKVSSSPSEAVRLTPQAVVGDEQVVGEPTNNEIVAAANVESEKEAKENDEPNEAALEDEEFLTDGSESFNRASEAPYAENIDEEVSEEVDEETVAAVLAANENTGAEDNKGDLVGDL